MRMPAYFFDDEDERLDRRDDRAYAILSVLAFAVGFMAAGLVLFIAIGMVVAGWPWLTLTFPLACAAVGALVGWWAR